MDDNPWPKYGLMWLIHDGRFDIEMWVFAVVLLILRLLGASR